MGRTTRVWQIVATVAVAALAVAGCGGDDDDAGGAGEPADAASAADADGAGDGGGGGGGAGGGNVVLGDETIEFESTRCFLQEQDAAAGGGKILFVAQAFGTDADGEPVAVDVSRYDEDSMFHGDDVTVDVGDPFGDSAVSWSGGGEVGTVTVAGSTVSADGLTFVNSDDFSEQPGSFTIDC
ncbi:MAG: hypothetical protein HKN41_00990 [Ilumatobacter sp.]|nr:hypothetical protein [Ilumatobacter sp.]